MNLANDVLFTCSGYGIAAQALTAVVRAHDGRGPQTALTYSILRALSLSSPDELIGWTYADPSWARIAALVPVVVSCADAGDEVANKILLESVEELASSVKAVVQRLGLCGEDGKGSFPLVMVGGVLEANKTWDIGKEVVNCIYKDYPGTLPIRPKDVYIALCLDSHAVRLPSPEEPHLGLQAYVCTLRYHLHASTPAHPEAFQQLQLHAL
ncbi:N-acetyl-D-glucosamine kinase [Vitis vinifera]|uniref:N-acetyl-D-glucosamine kinase n=1 Tax=Vitis vinifera TaxID=29760 RepID=A0A438HN83_VITVI|nr:N-acetyl-D-glucosamine kinase [Vitis vinifera]